MTAQNLNDEQRLNIRVAIVAAEIIDYSMKCINGKQAFKERLNVVKKSVSSLEGFFSHDPNLRSEFLRDEYVLFYALLKETVNFDSPTLEEIIEAIKNNVKKV